MSGVVRHLEGTVKISVGQATETGPKPRNEDCTGVRVPGTAAALASKGIAAAIADGVSAAESGKEAGETCVQGFLQDYYSTPDSWTVKTSAHRVLSALNRWLYAQGAAGAPGWSADERKGFVTTFSAVVVKSRTAHVVHVGDTRVYRVRGGVAEQITRDHSNQVSQETCYLTRAVGMGLDLRVDYHAVPVEEGDVFVLTTDGVHGHVSDHELVEALGSCVELDDVANWMLRAADAGGSRDNRTCLVLRVEALPEADRKDVFRQLSVLPFPPALAPGMRIDGLEVEKVIAESRRSQVYLVNEIATGKRSVMKTPSVNFEDDAGYLERFAMEEWVARRADSEHLVGFVDPPQVPKFMYFLVEYVEGMTLAEWARENPQPEAREVADLIGQAVEGVRALHRRETLHQDLKPDNLMIDPWGRVMIIDYGSCRVAGMGEIDPVVEPVDALGTMDFSAPEYRLGMRAGTAADQFSLGVVAYYLLSGGKHPYGTRWEKAGSVREFVALEYVPVTRHNPHVAAWVDGAVRRAVSVRAESRYESMSEFVYDLSHPNPKYVELGYVPLAERNPVRFWKAVAGLLAAGLVLALFFLVCT